MSSKSPGSQDWDVQEHGPPGPEHGPPGPNPGPLGPPGPNPGPSGSPSGPGQSSSSSSSNSDDEYSIEDSEAVTNSSTGSSGSSDNAEQEELDEFDQFLKYRGKFQSHHRVPPLNDDDMMCFYYFSDALGLNFSSKTCEEVYRLDQIKEWDPPESKWLVPPNILGTTT